MEQSQARGCPDKPSSPRARGPAPPILTGGAVARGRRCSARRRPVQRGATGHPGAAVAVARAPRAARPFSFLCAFLLPPHIPSDIIVRRRVRGAGPAGMDGFRPSRLYGEIQKSAAQAQNPEPARTRIPHFGAGAQYGSCECAGRARVPGEAAGAEEPRREVGCRVGLL
jgi:hypothetical protein